MTKTLSIETRRRMKVAQTGRRHPPAVVEKLRRLNLGKLNPIFGRRFHHLDETREKQRIAAIGRRLGEETKQKLRFPHPWMVGERNPNFGRVYTEEEKQYLRELNTGSNHPRWLGGISKLPYPFEFDYILKERIRSRDGYRCQLCHIQQSDCKRALCPHHIDYDKSNLAESNLISLCVRCNSYVNVDREFWTIYFTTLLEGRIENINSRC
jgi:hypothetical protein